MIALKGMSRMTTRQCKTVLFSLPSAEGIERKSVRQANELVKVAVNVIPPLAGPRLQYCYRPLPGQGHIELASAVYCTGWHSHTHTGKERKKREGGEREHTYCNTTTPLYNMHYIKSLSGSC